MRVSENIGFLGIGSHIPLKNITNQDIEKLDVGTTADWISERLGIQQRRITESGEFTSDLGYQAALKAIADAKIDKHEIDCLIVATSSPDRISPSTACIIQDKLGITCPAFDINAVCSGFVYAIEIATSFLESKKYKNILIVAAETYSKITDWNRRDCCFFGDGAGAVVIGNTNGGWMHSKIYADPKEGLNNFTCYIGEKFLMDGKAIFRFATTVLPKAIQQSMEELNLTNDDLKWIIPHQPNHRVLKKTAEILNISPDKILFNMINFGNTAGASIPMGLDRLYREGKIENGDILLMPCIGSGMTWGVTTMKFYKQ